MDTRNVILYGRPNLVRPNLVMGFEGWADAARISSGVVGQLRDRLHVQRLAEIKPDDFYVFQSPGEEARRPLTDVEDGLVHALRLPSTVFRFFKNRKGAPDLIISLAREPELRWPTYVDTVLSLAEEFGVERLYTVGGTYNNVPHTVDPMVTAVVSDESLKAEMAGLDIGLTEYGGPSSIHTLFAVAAKERGLPTVCLWGHAPYYVQVPNAKVCYGILSRLVRLLDIRIELDELSKAADYLDEQVDEAVRQSPELQEYVSGLELAYGGADQAAAEPPDEDLIREVEAFLRMKSREQPPGEEDAGA
jgi:proteasome assembly chaperone (PAC2) family protein